MSTAPKPIVDGARWTRPVILALVMVASTTVALLACLVVGVADGGFVVGQGYDRSDTWSHRKCIGLTHRPDSRDGWTDYCYGVPAGRWRCYERKDRETRKGFVLRKREVTCGSGAPVSEWRCFELLYDRVQQEYEQSELPCHSIVDDEAVPRAR